MKEQARRLQNQRSKAIYELSLARQFGEKWSRNAFQGHLETRGYGIHKTSDYTSQRSSPNADYNGDNLMRSSYHHQASRSTNIYTPSSKSPSFISQFKTPTHKLPEFQQRSYNLKYQKSPFNLRVESEFVVADKNSGNSYGAKLFNRDTTDAPTLLTTQTEAPVGQDRKIDYNEKVRYNMPGFVDGSMDTIFEIE